MKRKDWIPFVSLGVFMAVMNLTIAGFGFERINRIEVRIDRLDARIDRIEARIEARMDRLEDKLSALEQRVSRIEGVLRIRLDPTEPPADGVSGAPPE